MAPENRKKPGKRPSSARESRKTSEAPKHERTEDEKAAIARFERRMAEQPVAPRVKIEQKNGTTMVSVHHVDQGLGYTLLTEALGTADFSFVSGMLNQLTSAAQRRGQVSETDVNFLVSVIKDIKPRDQFEAMLAAQMAVVHEATMTFARRLANVDTIPQQESALNGFTKLTRTFATQLEALKRYRTGGEQKVTVQHVNVSEGGQAIVGNVTTQSTGTPATSQEIAAAPALTQSAAAPMPLIEVAVAKPIAQSKRSKNGRGSSA